MIPAVIRVIGKDIRVLPNEKLDEKYGALDLDALELSLQAGISDQQARETALHEILHAIEHQLGLKISEHNIRQISIGLFAVMRDNPTLVPFLFGDAK